MSTLRHILYSSVHQTKDMQTLTPRIHMWGNQSLQLVTPLKLKYESLFDLK